MKSRVIPMVSVPLLLLAVVGVCVVFYLPSLRSSARRAWKEKNIAEIAARVADPSWSADELARLRLQRPGDDTEWLSKQLIVTKKGEWLAYANRCRKQDGRILDIFLARGSDGRWYYSTYHFCIGMMVLQMDGQPEDLATFSKTYFLETFDGQSDDCLHSTWPPTSP